MMEWGIGLGVVGGILLIPGLIGTCYYQRKEVRQLQGESTPSSVSHPTVKSINLTLNLYLQFN